MRSTCMSSSLGTGSRRNRVNHLGGGVFLSKIYTFAFKFLKFAHFLAHLGGGGVRGVTPPPPRPPPPPPPHFDHWEQVSCVPSLAFGLDIVYLI